MSVGDLWQYIKQVEFWIDTIELCDGDRCVSLLNGCGSHGWRHAFADDLEMNATSQASVKASMTVIASSHAERNRGCNADQMT